MTTVRSGSSLFMTLTTVGKLLKRCVSVSSHAFPCICCRRCTSSSYYRQSVRFTCYFVKGRTADCIIFFLIYPYRTCPVWCTPSTMWLMPLWITPAIIRARHCVLNWPSLQSPGATEEKQEQVNYTSDMIYHPSMLQANSVIILTLSFNQWCN